MKNKVRVWLVAASCLAGCLDAQSHDGLSQAPVRAAGEHFTDCLIAIDQGVAGDTCEFDPEMTGTALSCHTLLPPRNVGIYGYHDIDIAAHCASGRLVLQRQRELDSADLTLRVTSDACLTYGTRIGGAVERCVADDLLPEPVGGAPFDFDAGGACYALLDGAAPAGSPCTGEVVCGLVEAQHVYENELDPEAFYGRPGTFTWCGGGRVRTAATLVELPCEQLDVEHDTYVCAM